MSDSEPSISNAPTREQWGSWAEFILSAVGYCIGFGNIWRFPYRTFANGGGAFLLPYAFMLLFVGIPFYLIEQSLAQYSSLGPLALWKCCPLFKGIGYASFSINFLVAIYYNVILGWVFYYLIHSFALTLPWAQCDHSWNTLECDSALQECRNQDGVMDGYVCRMDTTERERNWYIDSRHANWTSSAEEFWLHKVLHRSAGIDQGDGSGVLWPQFCSFVLAQCVVYLILLKGVKSSGKVVYVTATAPFLVLIILLIRGLTLPGMTDGIKFFIQPDFAKLADVNVWGSAANQIVYSLGLGFGGTQTMSSFKPFTTNTVRDTLIIAFSNSGTSIFAGFTVFSILGYLAHKLQTGVSSAIKDGLGLAFIAYPDVVLHLPGAPFWAVAFFFMMVNIGLDSVFTGIEAFTTPLIDEFPKLEAYRRHITAGCLATITILAIPMCTSTGIYWFQLFDWYSAWYSLFLQQLTQAVVIAYIYGVRRFAIDIETMTGSSTGVIWKICWLTASPFTLFCVILVNLMSHTDVVLGDYVYPWWATLFGWVLFAIGYGPIPCYAIYKIWATPGESLKERVMKNLRPSADWGPADPEHRRLNNKLIAQKLGVNFITDGSHEHFL